MKKEKTIMKVSCEEVEAHLKKCGKHFYGITEKYKKEIREEALEEFEKKQREELLQIVIEDVPHYAQKRLIKILTEKMENEKL